MSGGVIGKGAVAALALLLLVVVASALSAAVLMTGLSLVHGDVSAVPALGFWASFGAELALGSIAAMLRSAPAGK